MAGALPPNWLERVAESLVDHEDRRDSLQNFPPRYEVLDEISRGGMGIVYRAWDPQLGRNVALKVLRTEEGNAAEAHERFQREARLAAGLHHPHIVPVYDTGTWNGQDYIAMQLIDGQTLEQAKPDRRTALACIRDAARALQYAHEQGIVHRDIKPSNLMLDAQRRLYIMDFGIARQAVSSAGMTSPGTVVGTPAYMSPEQAQGLPLDARSDVYSLGATLYELVTGHAPYKGEALDVVESVRTKDPVSARRLVGDLSKNVAAIITGAMERRPQDRYPTAAALADDIDRYLAGERPLRRPRGLSYKIQREFVRHPFRAAATIMFCVLAVTTGVAVRIAYLNASKPVEAYVPPPAPPVVTIGRSEENKPPDPVPPPQPPEQPTPSPEETARNELIALRRKSARDNIDSGKLEAARQDIDALEKVAPDHAAELSIQLRKAEFEFGLKELAEATQKTEGTAFESIYAKLQSETFRDRKDRNKVLASFVFRRGSVLAEARKATEAIKAFDEAERLGIDDASLFEQRGQVLVDLEQWDRAETDLHSLVARSGNRTVYPKPFAKIYYRKEQQALRNQDWAQALKLSNDALGYDSTFAAVYHDRGLARYRASKQARETLQQDLKVALDLNSKLVPDPQYREILIRYCRMQSEAFWHLDDSKARDAAWQEVAGWLDRANGKLYPNDPDLLLERAIIRRRTGDLSSALQDAREALKLRKDGGTTLAVGILTFLEGRLPKPDVAKTNEAIRLFSDAEKLSAGDYRPLYWRGLCRRDLGGEHLDAALQDLKEAFRLHAVSPYLALQLAETRLQVMFRDKNTNQWKESAEEAARAVNDAESLSEEDLVASLYELQRLSRGQAVRLITRDAHLCRAQAFRQGFELDRSIEESTEAIRLDPQLREAYIWRGYAQCTAKNHQSAREDFKQAIKVSSTPGDRSNAEDWLNRCMRHK